MHAATVFIGLALMIPLVASASADATMMEEVPFVVRFDEMPDGLATGSLFGGGRILNLDRTLGFGVVGMPRMVDATSVLSKNAGVLSVESDAKIKLIEMTPDDPMFSQQYGPQQVRAPIVWEESPGAVAASLCIVDTGVRYTHEDIIGPRWLGGYDFENNDDDPMDDNGHGTHVAGTAAGSTGNGRGIAGVAQVGIFGVKALDAEGSGSLSNVASGIRWCADNSASVISMSLGSPSPSSVMLDAVRYAANKGSLIIAAAGNDGQCKNCVNYPAAYAEVLAVTCTDSKSAQCSFSSEGREAEIAAPGHQIVAPWVTSDSSYKTISGTSMSTPHVSGVAALIKSYRPSISPDQIRQLLRDTAQDLGEPGFDEKFGYGLVDAAAAFAVLDGGKVPARPGPDGGKPSNPSPQPTGDAPVAVAGNDITLSDDDGDLRGTVVLDGSKSYDPDGEIASYEWRVGRDVVSREATFELDVANSRTRVMLIVTDDDGNQASDLIDVFLKRNSRPTAAFAVACEGTTCTFDATSSTDPDGKIEQYAWWIEWDPYEGAKVTHEFRGPGTYPVSLTVGDGGCLSGRTHGTVRVTVDEATGASLALFEASEEDLSAKAGCGGRDRR